MLVTWGTFVYRNRARCIALALVFVAALGLYGLGLAEKLTQEGWFDDSSESVHGAKLADSTYGRETDGDIIALYSPEPGVSLDDPAVAARARNVLSGVMRDYPDRVLKIDSYWDDSWLAPRLRNGDHAFASIGLRSSGSQTLVDYQAIKPALEVPGLRLQLAGIQPVTDALNEGMQRDIKRAEMIALPAVAVVLYFVFGGVLAALLPVLIGGMTVLVTQGFLRLETHVVDVNAFASAIITLVALGLAIDYGLLIVTRFREELATGSDIERAVAVATGTAGRTVAFSAAIITTCLAALLIYPQAVLKSVPYGAIVAVLVAAGLSLTVVPAVLGVLGRHIDWLAWSRLSRRYSPEQIDRGRWSRLAQWVMRRPAILAAGVTGLLVLLIVPFAGISFAGMSERYLDPRDPVRIAQEDFDSLFPGFRTEPIRLVVVGADNAQLGEIRDAANRVPGFTGTFDPKYETRDGVNVLQAGLGSLNDAGRVIPMLRDIRPPPGVKVYVAGIPALEYDSIQGLLRLLPVLIAFLVLVSLAWMWFAFSSLVLALKGVIVGALSLASTLGVLTWIFVDGYGAGLFGFTPGPIMFAVLVIVVTVIFGLSTDYEIFLVTRMVEARERGATTRESIRHGMAHTGGVITAAATILIVVTIAFAASSLVLMKCLAFGMIIALVLDATIIRMILVPAVMTLLGDRCWAWPPPARLRLRRHAPTTPAVAAGPDSDADVVERGADRGR